MLRHSTRDFPLFTPSPEPPAATGGGGFGCPGRRRGWMIPECRGVAGTGGVPVGDRPVT